MVEAVHLTEMSLNMVTQGFLNIHVFTYTNCVPYIVTFCVSGNTMWQFEFHPNPASSVEAQTHLHKHLYQMTESSFFSFLSTVLFF